MKKRICDLQSGAGQLAQAFAQLNTTWQEIRPHWRDNVAREFEEQHLQEIPARMKILMGAISQLAETLDQASRECAEPNNEPL